MGQLSGTGNCDNCAQVVNVHFICSFIRLARPASLPAAHKSLPAAAGRCRWLCWGRAGAALPMHSPPWALAKATGEHVVYLGASSSCSACPSATDYRCCSPLFGAPYDCTDLSRAVGVELVGDAWGSAPALCRTKRDARSHPGRSGSPRSTVTCRTAAAPYGSIAWGCQRLQQLLLATLAPCLAQRLRMLLVGITPRAGCSRGTSTDPAQGK